MVICNRGTFQKPPVGRQGDGVEGAQRTGIGSPVIDRGSFSWHPALRCPVCTRLPLMNQQLGKAMKKATVGLSLSYWDFSECCLLSGI